MVSPHAGHPVAGQIVRLLKQTWLEWWQSNAFEIGAALAFYAIFSIAPVMVLAFTAASLVLYAVSGDLVDLGIFARQPRLWMGNPALIAFAPCKEGWDSGMGSVSLSPSCRAARPPPRARPPSNHATSPTTT